MTDGVRVNQDKAQVEGNLKYAVLYIGKGQEGGRLIPVRLDGSLHFVENVNLSCDASDTDVTCKAYIEDLTIKPVNSRKISVKAIVSITVTCEEIKMQKSQHRYQKMRDVSRSFFSRIMSMHRWMSICVII